MDILYLDKAQLQNVSILICCGQFGALYLSRFLILLNFFFFVNVIHILINVDNLFIIEA